MPYRFSHTIQWMSSGVAFACEQDAPSVKITSYINNLHPVSYKTLYAAIEEVISLSIKPCNEVLVRRSRPRKPPRIRCYSVPWIPAYPTWAHGLQAISKDTLSEEYQEAKQKIGKYLAIPSPRTGQPGFPGYESYDLDKRDIMPLAMQHKHTFLKTGWTHPEPSDAFSYPEWKVGKGATDAVARLRVSGDNNNRRPLLREPGHEFYTVSPQDTFREQGLQVTVKPNTIELNPKNPAFAGTDWHIDGLLKQHIVASSMVCLSGINTTPTPFSFRVEADLDAREHAYEALNLTELASVLDLPSGRHLGSRTGGGPASQELGSISSEEGRLVAMPNVLQRHMEPFVLEDVVLRDISAS
ncbi:hypothetical protein AB5N19_12394 [Seiridium cardinale]